MCIYPIVRKIAAAKQVLLLAGWLLWPIPSDANLVRVRYREGVSHGFLVLRTLDGKAIAYGEAEQVPEGKDGDRVTNRLQLRFNDGSYYDETTVFLQRDDFGLVSDHVLQKGPSFKPNMETWIDATNGSVSVRYTDNHGKEKALRQTLHLPPDIANGIIFIVLKDIPPGTPQTTLSYLATSPKPRLIHLQILPQGEDTFSVAGHPDKARRYLIKVQIGGVTGVVAPLIGKQPPNIQAWIVTDGAPTFARMDGPLYGSGPVWRMELALPPKWLTPASGASSTPRKK